MRCGGALSGRWRSTHAASNINVLASRTPLQSSTSCWPRVDFGAEGKGYGTITGQGNGQAGREHGQKADQLPGARDIEDPEHRAFIAEDAGASPRPIFHMPGSPRSSSSTRSEREA